MRKVFLGVTVGMLVFGAVACEPYSEADAQRDLTESKARLEAQRQKDAEAKWYREKLAEDRARQIRQEEARRRSRWNE